jgi:hypothetical protein
LEVCRVLKDKGVIIIAFPYTKVSNSCSGITNAIRSYYNHPWQFIRAATKYAVLRVSKLISRGEKKITVEHPFPLPTDDEIAGYLPANLEIIEKRSTEAHHFFVVQNDLNLK